MIIGGSRIRFFVAMVRKSVLAWRNNSIVFFAIFKFFFKNSPWDLLEKFLGYIFPYSFVRKIFSTSKYLGPTQDKLTARLCSKDIF